MSSIQACDFCSRPKVTKTLGKIKAQREAGTRTHLFCRAARMIGIRNLTLAKTTAHLSTDLQLTTYSDMNFE